MRRMRQMQFLFSTSLLPVLGLRLPQPFCSYIIHPHLSGVKGVQVFGWGPATVWFSNPGLFKLPLAILGLSRLGIP